MSSTATRAGIAIGAVLALTWVAFGFWAFVFVAFAMAIGAIVGRVIEGKLDLSAVVGAFRGKRSSS
ncbi:hypothetical protein B7R54_18125 [Subtercola boreus]|uniref:DUF2273 domain-containing protein n=1 Tax=Subtercola boreus TaxID=120213 RepID=A0A3E0VN61_9MICO|nr:DUF2273 domain-containing protein [Subtercola boreus]RFA10910.1 hypothetical protein B7R54_18125 [Subtercola boreus]TQL55499.1 small integral membrane protein DUF2273 [Subtercola boreus]